MSGKPTDLRQVEALEKIGKQLERLVKVQKMNSLIAFGATIAPMVGNDDEIGLAKAAGEKLQEQMDEI